MINIDNDNSLLTAGVWVEFGGSEFLVTHMSNVAFQRAYQRLMAPHKSKLDKGTLDPEISKKAMTKAMSQALILDWKKVADSAGNEVPFSAETCFKALNNNDDLRDFISDFAMNLDNYKQERIDELGKS